MNEQGPDPSLLIGLHKLAEQNGDGLVPELYALLAERPQSATSDTNVVPFPTLRRTASPTDGGKTSARILKFRR